MTRSVVVISGGPAGSAAAISAALDSGCVGLIEKSRFPRHKVCGEFLSPEIRPILERLRSLDPFLALNPSRIRRMILRIGCREKRAALPELAFGLSRYTLDKFLWERAVGAGAVPMQQTWTPRFPQEHGAATVVAVERKAPAPPGNRLFGFKAHFTGPPDDAVELFFFGDCYVGVSCVEGGVTNVCGLAPERILRSFAFDPDGLLSKSRPLMRRLQPLHRLFDWMIAGPLVFRQRFVDAARAGVYRTGDALAFVDPFTGSGILNALLTGLLAGRCAARNSPASFYQAECRHALAKPFWISSILRHVLRLEGAPALASLVPMQLLFRWMRPSRGLTVF